MDGTQVISMTAALLVMVVASVAAVFFMRKMHAFRWLSVVAIGIAVASAQVFYTRTLDAVASRADLPGESLQVNELLRGLTDPLMWAANFCSLLGGLLIIVGAAIGVVQYAKRRQSATPHDATTAMSGQTTRPRA